MTCRNVYIESGWMITAAGSQYWFDPDAKVAYNDSRQPHSLLVGIRDGPILPMPGRRLPQFVSGDEMPFLEEFSISYSHS